VSVRKRDVIVDVAQFVLLIIALSALFAVLIIRAGHIGSGRSLYTRALMWSPGVAALLLLRRRGVSWREIGWTWTGRWEWVSYFAVLSAGLLVYGFAWVAGLMDFPDSAAVNAIATDFGWRQLPKPVVVAGYATFTMTLGMMPAVTSALGEEIGWRGFLVPRLASQFSFTATALITGGIWAVWHYPMFMVTDYYRSGHLWYSLTCFTTLLLAASVICTWLRLKSGSIWPAVMLHAANNLFVQDVMRPLAGSGRWSQYAIDQFGGLLPLFAVVVAVTVWYRRADVEKVSIDRPPQEAEATGFASLERIA
jgi:membrane protease YdiL (CAAX protease family)